MIGILYFYSSCLLDALIHAMIFVFPRQKEHQQHFKSLMDGWMDGLTSLLQRQNSVDRQGPYIFVRVTFKTIISKDMHFPLNCFKLRIY